jgi:hypothetical protein
LTDGLALEPDVQKAITDCTSKKPQFGKPQDLTTCIADVEALIPGVEKVIADIKAGDYTSALTDGLALEPDVQKAITDCTSSVAPHMYRRIHHVKKMLMKIDVGDLPTCISDIESAIPDLEKIIADFKAGNYEQALTDGLALVPVIEKAATDCLSSAKALGGRFKTILKDDPKREYFEKLGAEFARGFFAGTRVDDFDAIDMYNCLHREPTAVGYFYKADEEMKFALQHRDEREIIKALDGLIGFLFELVKEDYPHSHVEVCKEFQDREAQWKDAQMVIDDLKSPERTLQVHDHHFYFNHQDISLDLHELVEDYVSGNW